MKNNEKGKVWFITGAGRGMGLEIAKAALATGHKVIATGRHAEKVTKALGQSKNLLAVKLDVTKSTDAELAVKSAVERFGAIDVLVNNAGNFYAGFFEELSIEQIQNQINTNLFGQMIVARAVLPQMRKQHGGHIISISSTAGLVGYEYCTAYAASKFAVEGWMDSLRIEIAPFNIKTTIVNPGFFRTGLLEPGSTMWPEKSIDAYSERNAQLRPFWESMSGKQGGDPEKLAKALITVADQQEPPLRWFAGADAVVEGERKANELLSQTKPNRELSSSLAIEEVPASA
ncbi:MAG TPA: SDR family oxidoreductase [Cyclobacteriaceae bacterium]|jgi:NAD(P)-dependent dehydrogenase (short-subunit alcohol dehydrogenase family)|nr:SDR family oxidoreductase [Cyclobacteriaceae bacterium]